MNALDAKVAVVTGASSGIGAATARLLVEKGWAVVGCDVSPRRGDDTELSPSDRLTHRSLDVSNAHDVAATFADIIAEHGRIDGLANVAGVNDGFSSTHNMSDRVWDRVIGIDLSGPFYCARAVLPTMMETGGGAIVNVSSIAGISGAVSGAAYTAAKHGVIGLTRSIAAMYREQSIRCNAVLPGSVATNIKQTDSEVDDWTRPLRKLWGQRANKPSHPNELASAIAFLLSDEASSVNGAIMTVDGGWTA